MNKIIKNYLTVIVLMVVTVLTGCKKEKKETVPICKTCQQNTYDSNGNLLIIGSNAVYCDSELLRIESTQDVIVRGITTKWVCK